MRPHILAEEVRELGELSRVTIPKYVRELFDRRDVVAADEVRLLSERSQANVARDEIKKSQQPLADHEAYLNAAEAGTLDSFELPADQIAAAEDFATDRQRHHLAAERTRKILDRLINDEILLGDQIEKTLGKVWKKVVSQPDPDAKMTVAEFESQKIVAAKMAQGVQHLLVRRARHAGASKQEIGAIVEAVESRQPQLPTLERISAQERQRRVDSPEAIAAREAKKRKEARREANKATARAAAQARLEPHRKNEEETAA